MTLSHGAWPRHASALLLLLSTGCAAVPDLGPKPMPRAPSSYASANSFAVSARDVVSEWPELAWWPAYRDPQLTQLIEEAIAGSPDIAAAAARMRTAEG
jgi:outer membrane protein TolC